jgi:hypothetical protein
MFQIEINDGITKSIGAENRARLVDLVAEHYDAEVELTETDDGELVSFVGGPHIGYIRRAV